MRASSQLVKLMSISLSLLSNSAFCEKEFLLLTTIGKLDHPDTNQFESERHSEVEWHANLAVETGINYRVQRKGSPSTADLDGRHGRHIGTYPWYLTAGPPSTRQRNNR